MHFREYGLKEGPLLVCVPGLLGGPDDFAHMLDSWGQKFKIAVIDPHHERREQGINNLSAQVVQEISFNSTSDEIAQVIQRLGSKAAYLVGISLGGKIVYDFAHKYPSLFAGGVISDVGPAPFESSDLYKFIDTTVAAIDLNLPWPELKQKLQVDIPERNLRILIQSQISYPEQTPPGIWKIGMRNFRTMLERQAIADQFEALYKVDNQLISQKSILHVLHAARLSGIASDSLPNIRKLKSIQLHFVPDASHFLHVTHKDTISNLVLQLHVTGSA